MSVAGPSLNQGESLLESAFIRGNPIMLLAGFLASDCCEGIPPATCRSVFYLMLLKARKSEAPLNFQANLLHHFCWPTRLRLESLHVSFVGSPITLLPFL